DGQDLVRRDIARGEQVRDPVGEHPGLPRAGAGHDEQRAALVHHGSALFRIESVEESIYREGGHLHSVGASADKSSERGACGALNGQSQEAFRLSGTGRGSTVTRNTPEVRIRTSARDPPRTGRVRTRELPNVARKPHPVGAVKAAAGKA